MMRRSEEQAREMVYFTLRKMAAGGLRDHLGGGFHRYSVDEFWHVPHFEKMLYDQAQLAVSYLEAWQATGDEYYASIVRETLDYVLRDMTHPQGGFFSAEDADSLRSESESEREHAEGAFYVWTRAEILEVLGEEAGEIFCRHCGVKEAGNAPAGSDPHGEFTGQNILIEREVPLDPSLAESRMKLFAKRSKRPRPHLDDKVITAWNGLMISAFAQAGVALREPRFLEAARRAAGFIGKHLTAGGELLRSWREEPGTIRGFAEDYSFLIQGLLDLYESDLDETWLKWAADLQARQDALFWDEAAGNYFSSAAGDALVAIRMKEDYDGAEPSANSVSARNLLRLGRMLNDGGLEARARDVIAACANTLQRVPTAVPQMLVALDLALSAPAQIVIAGKREEEAVRLANEKLHAEFSPRRVVMLTGEWIAGKNPELAEMKPVDGRPALYRCENFACQRPEVLE
jgi:uncharacterized protein YyaL (SSP411 family)